jgi:hypothetical protein
MRPKIASSINHHHIAKNVENSTIIEKFAELMKEKSITSKTKFSNRKRE